jgi:hypothetical protein
MRILKWSMRGVVVLPLVLAVALIGIPAEAQDAKGEKELMAHAQKIDKTADRAAPEKVVDKVAAQFSGDQFACDNKFVQCGTSPLGTLKTLNSEQLESLVKTLRTGSPSLGTKGLGFGEISILLALASRTGQSPDAIVQLRQSGMGWGQIAHHFNLKLGPLNGSLKATEKRVEEAANAVGPLQKVGKPEKGEKADKPDKMDKPEKVQRVERPVRPEKPGR